MTNLDHLSTETLADYAEGLLRESEAAAVDAHLDGCADCRAEELLLKSLSEILAADSPGPMPAVYAARIDAALAEVAMTDPLSGSFHPEGSAFQGAALDLTPSAFASSSAAGLDGTSADVVDLSARRRLVAQGLSRVTTVAASIVLLVGGTVLGLQAINSGEPSGNADNNPSVAKQTGKAIRPTTQPSVVTRVTAVPIDPKAKKNSDGSFTNPDGTVIRKDGSAVTPKGDVIKPKPAPIGDPAATNPPDQNAGTSPVTGKGGGGVAAARGPSGPYVPGTEPTPPADNSSAVAPGPAAGPTQDAAAADPSKAPVAKAETVATPDATTDSAGAKTAAAPADSPPPSASQAYFDQSGDTYDTTNFAKKVLALLKKGNYQASSTGDATPDQAPAPATNPDPAVSPASSNTFAPSSIAVSMPAAADAAAAPDAADSAKPAFKQRAIRCASFYSGDLLAADLGIWEGKAATIVVMTDPKDSNQVVGRVFTGNCKDRASTETGLLYTQFVVTKTS